MRQDYRKLSLLKEINPPAPPSKIPILIILVSSGAQIVGEALSVHPYI